MAYAVQNEAGAWQSFVVIAAGGDTRLGAFGRGGGDFRRFRPPYGSRKLGRPMDPIEGLGALALVPASTAIVLAFLTRNTLFALTVACLAGVLVAGLGPAGFPKLLVTALGNEGFAWVMLLEFFIGMLIAFFQRTGAIENFSVFISRQAMTRRRVQLMTWLMGTFVYFSDYFSPLFVGSTMRKLSDQYRISREKLAYICDSTSAPVSILPITGWAVFVAGLTIGMGPIGTADEALAVFVASVPYNLYAWMAVLLVALVPGDFSPTGVLWRRLSAGRRTQGGCCPGSQPMLAEELTGLEPLRGVKPASSGTSFPVLLVIGFALTAVALVGSAKPMEAFLLAVVVSAVIMRFQGFSPRRDHPHCRHRGEGDHARGDYSRPCLRLERAVRGHADGGGHPGHDRRLAQPGPSPRARLSLDRRRGRFSLRALPGAPTPS